MPEDKHSKALDWSDPETKRQYMKVWRAANVERRRESKRAYDAAHPEKKKEAGRRYYHGNIKNDPEKLAKKNLRTKEWDAANPEQHKARCDRYVQAHRELLAEKAKAAYRAKSEEER